jgi:hypothetical protein
MPQTKAKEQNFDFVLLGTHGHCNIWNIKYRLGGVKVEPETKHCVSPNGRGRMTE